jgi:hypothetical protein
MRKAKNPLSKLKAGKILGILCDVSYERDAWKIDVFKKSSDIENF